MKKAFQKLVVLPISPFDIYAITTDFCFLFLSALAFRPDAPMVGNPTLPPTTPEPRSAGHCPANVAGANAIVRLYSCRCPDSGGRAALGGSHIDQLSPRADTRTDHGLMLKEGNI